MSRQKVTGISDAEEEIPQFSQDMPLLETELLNRGGTYETADGPIGVERMANRLRVNTHRGPRLLATASLELLVCRLVSRS